MKLLVRLFGLIASCFALASVLGACASGPKTVSVWVKDGATSQDYSMDRGQCNAQGFSVPGAPLLQVAMVINACMQGKGWHVENRPAPE